MPSSSFSPVTLILLLLTMFSCLQHFCVSSFEFQVGGSKGWVVPPANDTQVYNDWASHNRFQVGDSIRFKYKKDSVMEVTKADYNNCNSSYPNFFSNTGNTVFRFDHSGPFYFISGASGHCDKGQRMIVKVMLQEESLPEHAKSSGFHDAVSPIRVTKLVFFHIVVGFWQICLHM